MHNLNTANNPNLSDYFNYNFNEVTFNAYSESIREKLAESVKRILKNEKINLDNFNININSNEYIHDYLFNKLPIELGGVGNNFEKKDIINYQFDILNVGDTKVEMATSL